MTSASSFPPPLPPGARRALLFRLRLWCMLASLFVGVSAHADLIASIARTRLSVVIVGTFRATDSPRFTLRGTGFVVGDGTLVVTNAHVLADPGGGSVDASVLALQVRRPDNELEMRQGSVLEIDKAHDLALIKMTGPPAPAMAIGDSDAVKEGRAIAFTGFPIGGALGFSPVTHRGIVSSVTPVSLPTASAQQLSAQAIRSLRSASFNIFQLDATAYPGNSGGPVFDPDTAELLGVINMVFLKSTRESALTHPSGISYAIPARFVLELVRRNP